MPDFKNILFHLMKSLDIAATFGIISQLQSTTLISYSEWTNLLFSITRNATRCAPRVQNFDVKAHYKNNKYDAQAWYKSQYCTPVNERSLDNCHLWSSRDAQLKEYKTSFREMFELAQPLFLLCTIDDTFNFFGVHLRSNFLILKKLMLEQWLFP